MSVRGDELLLESPRTNELTGRPSQPLSTPSSPSQLSAPMFGRIREAKCNTMSRYTSAKRTGLGSVLDTKFMSVCICGRMFDNRGVLDFIVRLEMPRWMRGDILGQCGIKH